MARLPITVKGIRKLIDSQVDNAMEALKKFNNNAKLGDTLKAGGPLVIAGTYAVDQNGDLGFLANVVAPAPVTGEVGGEGEIGWNGQGQGTMTMTFLCEVNATRAAE
jgi:hypothetical protein